MFYQQRGKPSTHVRRRKERSTSNLWSCAVRLTSAILLLVLFRDVHVPVSLSGHGRASKLQASSFESDSKIRQENKAVSYA